MKQALTLAAALLAAAPLAAELEFKPALQADLRGRYEHQPQPVRSGWGQNADLFMIPAFSWGRHSLLPVLGVLQQGRGSESRADDAPELFFVRRNTFLAKPTWQMDGDAWVWRAWGGAKRAVNAEQHDTAWSKGLYDWEEFSFGAGGDRKLGGAVDRVGFGLELLNRTYMNWHEAGTGLTGGKNYYTKDYQGLKASLNARSGKGSTVWSTELTWLGKAYVDNYLLRRINGAGGETTDGTLDLDKRRFDQLIRLGAALTQVSSQTTTLSFDLGVDWNLSGQSYFDQTLLQGVVDFYGYVNPRGGMSLSWEPQGSEGPRYSLRTGLGVRAYTGRTIRFSDGSYGSTKQSDIELSLDLGYSQPLPVQGLSLVAGTGLTRVRSNTSFTPGTLPEYDLYTTTLGLKYRL
jgi:hypothetical protein